MMTDDHLNGQQIDQCPDNIGYEDMARGWCDEDFTRELAIPWTELDIRLSPSLRIGIVLNVSDNGGPGTAVQEMMKSSSATRIFLPRYLGYVDLARVSENV